MHSPIFGCTLINVSIKMASIFPFAATSLPAAIVIVSSAEKADKGTVGYSLYYQYFLENHSFIVCKALINSSSSIT